MEHALRLSADGYAHAALERLEGLLESRKWTTLAERSLLYDEIGKLHIQQNQVEAARKAFAAAAADAQSADEQAKCEIHLAMTYYVQSDFDRAYRLLNEIDNRLGEDIPAARRGVLFNNLASVQWATQFYREAADSMTKSLAFFEGAGVTYYNSRLYSNLGVCYTELREYDTAETYIRQAIEYADDEVLFAYIALARMYLLSGDYEQSILYMQKAVPLYDEFPQLVDPLKTAYVCLILAELAFHGGELRLAKQLMEKAELQFGILGQWRVWDGCRARILEWDELGLPMNTQPNDSSLMKRFLLIVEAWNTQEFIGDSFSEFIDTRVMFAAKLADRFVLPAEDKYHLVTAARLADYGLTALDTEVIDNPVRSDAAWRQYCQHPLLSTEMLRELQLPEAVYRLIESHHERPNGTGYPRSTSGTLGLTHSILQLADAYAEAVVLQRQSHSTAIAEMMAEKGAFHSDVLATFLQLFEL